MEGNYLVFSKPQEKEDLQDAYNRLADVCETDRGWRPYWTVVLQVSASGEIGAFYNGPNHRGDEKEILQRMRAAAGAFLARTADLVDNT